MLNRVPHLILFLIITVLFCIQVNTGIADNGDFDRSVGWLLEKPVGFSSNNPDSGSWEWGKRYFSQWHADWEYQPTISNPPYTISSYQLLFLLGVSINKAIGLPDYSVIVAGIFLKLLLVLVALVLCKNAFGEMWVWWAVPFFLIVFDTKYIAFFNSFYQEQASILFFFSTIACLFIAIRSETLTSVIVLSIFSLLFATTKPQFFLTPLIVGCSLLLQKPVDIKRLKIIVFPFLFVQIISFVILLDNKFSDRNSFNSMFNGALYFDKDYFPADLDPSLRECVGINAWSADPNCFEKAGKIEFKKIAEVYLDNPQSFIRGIEFVLKRLNIIDLGVIYAHEIISVNTRDTMLLVNIWNRIKSLGTGIFVFVELITLFLIGIATWKYIQQRTVLFFLQTFLWFQIFITILGEGSVDLEKHLLLANLALDLSMMISLYAILRLFNEIRSRRAVMVGVVRTG